ncbi:NAD(P)H-hydrate dehydratase [Foetidibacter luteolus]|uniref:NAD(P)H-hydrate dehydratase n=1 Tax=Foetidibacter luteolus TaxID=2608880 RepID=UPI00129A591F|nr:NAD(P)H-hydrate dehydratase [Foetidibacter luteolus]
MKILNAQQIHQWDAYTIEHEPITSLDLMERAARRCTDWIIQQPAEYRSIKIFCGKGNNGGDGLAIARQLINEGFNPVLYILEFGAKGTEDFQANLSRMHELTREIYFIQSSEFFPELDEGCLVLDALFGSGLNRPLQDLSAELVEHINNCRATVIAIDVPSGMFTHKSSLGNSIVKASATLTFQSLKLCFLVAENAAFFGEVAVLDIGLHPGFLQVVETSLQLTTHSLINRLVPVRKNFSHKGTYGHALLLAGNTGKIGAALLAARACLRSGAGLLTCSLPESSLPILHGNLPEAMAVTRTEPIDWNKYNAIGIGPGLGTKTDAATLLTRLLSAYTKPIVADADALNIMAGNNRLLPEMPIRSILTPHPKEFDRLFGESASDFDRINKAIQYSKESSLIIVLKGRYSLVACDGKGWFNTTGNPGMATGGSGDVLTGIITALLAQQYPPLHAALTAVYLHGLAADIALENQSEESLLPGDIIDNMGKAFKACRL